MRENRVPLIWILLIAGLFCIAAFDARATDRNNSEATSEATASSSASVISSPKNVLTANSVMNADSNISGDKNRAYALSGSLGDVDINDCLASTQLGLFVVFQRQGLVENPWCQAMYLDAIGAYDAAAKVRCTTETLQTIYLDPVECEFAVKIRVPPPPVEEDIDSDDEDDEDYHEQLEAAVVALRAEFEALQAEKAKALARVAKAEKVAQRAAAAPQERYMDYEQRRQAAKDILEGKK